MQPGPTEKKVQSRIDERLAQRLIGLSGIDSDNAGAAHVCATADAGSCAFARMSGDGPAKSCFELIGSIREVGAAPPLAKDRQHVSQSAADAFESGSRGKPLETAYVPDTAMIGVLARFCV